MHPSDMRPTPLVLSDWTAVINRRTSLEWAVLALVAVLSDACGLRDRGAAVRVGILAEMPEAALRAIGLAYRAAVPTEGSEAVLWHLISAGRANWSLAWHESPLDRVIREEFATGQTAVVDGWVLSLTEARICALLSLTPRPTAG